MEPACSPDRLYGTCMFTRAGCPFLLLLPSFDQLSIQTMSLSPSSNPCLWEELPPPGSPSGRQAPVPARACHYPGRPGDLSGPGQMVISLPVGRHWVESMSSASGHWDLGRRWMPTGPVPRGYIQVAKETVQRTTAGGPG